MLQDKSNKWILVFLISIVLLPLLHLFDSFTIPKRVNNLTDDVKILTSSYELSLDISELISSTRAYIIYSDEKYLEQFHRLSNQTTKKEIDLYNAVDPSEREKISELITIKRKYISFVDEDVIPAVQAGTNKESTKLIMSRYESLSSQLQEKADTVSALRSDKISKDSSNIISLETKKRTLSFILIFSSLLLLIVGTRKFLLPMLTEFSRMEQLTANTKSAAVVTNPKGQVKIINKEAEKLLGISAAGIKDKTLNETVTLFPYTQNIIQPLFNVILERKEINDHQTFYDRTGHKTLLTIDYIPFFMNNRLTGAAMIARPVEIHRDKGLLFEAIEAERKKISIEIHDWIGRNMSPIIHSLDYILNSGADNIPQETHDQLIQLRKHCQNAVNDMRSIMNDIHPYLLDKVGLMPALESYTRHFEQTQGIKIYLFYEDRPLDLTKTTQIVIYRIIQEALSNVTKHSNAGEVDIFFAQEDETLKIEIIDNGDISQETGNGKGLWGMKERANLIGGDLVYGFTDGGFAVTLTVPLLKGEQPGGER